MQASPNALAIPERPLAISAPGVVVDAVALAQAVLGSANVTLTGFGGNDAVVVPWTHPEVSYLPPAADPMAALEVIENDGRRFRVVAAVVGGLLAIAAFAGGVLFGTVKLPSALAHEALMSWTVVDVLPNGLLVATPSGRAVVPVGGRLPNGDAVIAVNAAAKSAALTGGTLLLNKAAVPAPAAHP